MIVPNQFITVKWHHKNRVHYESKGYKFTAYKDEFQVKAEDMNPTSHNKVKVQCDYCGAVMTRDFRRYILEHDEELGDTCHKCKRIKQEKTNQQKYGVDWCLQREDFKQKQIDTCREKYGVDYISQDAEFRQSVISSCLERYGVSNISCNEDIKRKKSESFYEHGTCPTSQQQIQLCEMLKEIYGKCELNYPVDGCSLDCYVEIDGIKIDVEYDGWYWHKDKQESDKRRNYFLIHKGYRVLRFICKNEMPTKECIQKNIDKIVKNGNHLIIVDLINDR